MIRKYALYIYIITILFSLNSYANSSYRKLGDESLSYSLQSLNKLSQPVSVAPITDNKYLIANYSDLFIFDREGISICKMNYEKEDIKGIYNPTGVYFDNGYAYVANYKGNNTLKLKLNIELCSFTVISEYSSHDSKGPENVYVFGDNLYTANYDSGTVTKFSVKSRKLLWSSAVGQAHGVTLFNNKVYSTSLSSRAIYVLDDNTGKLIKKVGQIGWRPDDSEYLWPTTIANFGNRLVISDAQTGFVQVRSESLELEYFFGGNGPSSINFNMPYSTVYDANNDEFLVTSAFSDELFFIDSSQLSVKEVYNLTSAPKYNKPKFKEADYFHEVNSNHGYRLTGKPQLSIGGLEFSPGFSGIFNGGRSFKFGLPDDGFNIAGYLYFTDSLNLEFKGFKGVLLFSPQSVMAYAYLERFSKVYFLPIFLPKNTWKVGGRLFNSNHDVDINKLQNKLDSLVNDIETSRSSLGIVSKENIASIVSQNLISQLYNEKLMTDLQVKQHTYSRKIHKNIKKLFESDENLQKLDFQLNICEDEKLCDMDLLESRYQTVIFSMLSRNDVPLESLFTLKMMMPISFGNVLEDNSSLLEKCSDSKYYPGYGVEDFKNKAAGKYISAVNIQSSTLCINKSLAKNHSIKGVFISWYDNKNKPKKIQLLDVEGNDIQFKRVNVSKKSDYLMIDQNGFQLRKIIVAEGGIQNRLIIDALKIISNPHEQSIDDVLKLNQKVHNSLEYGSGRNFDQNLMLTKSYKDLILDNKVGHCGHYVYLLSRELDTKYNWRGYDITTYDGRIHSVLEVNINGSWKVFDPTLGIYYDCSFDELNQSSCLVGKEKISTIENRFKGYFGSAFFSAAKSIRRYRDFSSNEPNKLIPRNVLSFESNGAVKGYDAGNLFDNNRSTYFSSSGNQINIKLKKMDVYAIHIEGYRYISNDVEQLIFPQEFMIEAKNKGDLVFSERVSLKEPTLLYKHSFGDLTIDELNLSLDSMFDNNQNFILRSIKLF